MNEQLNFNLCDKSFKKVYQNICLNMGVRTKVSCYCIIDGKVCDPWCDFKNKRIEDESI